MPKKVAAGSFPPYRPGHRTVCAVQIDALLRSMLLIKVLFKLRLVLKPRL
jgi:hypothetical protein